MVETRFHAPAPPTPNHLFDPECFHWKVYCRIAIFRSSVIETSASHSLVRETAKVQLSIRILRYRGYDDLWAYRHPCQKYLNPNLLLELMLVAKPAYPAILTHLSTYLWQGLRAIFASKNDV